MTTPVPQDRLLLRLCALFPAPALALALLLAACAPREDFDYVNTDEIPPGPGLFTGASGEYEVLRLGTGGGADEDAAKTGGAAKQDPGAVPEGLPPDRKRRSQTSE